jgi:hypothetical protein
VYSIASENACWPVVCGLARTKAREDFRIFELVAKGEVVGAGRDQIVILVAVRARNGNGLDADESA